MRHKNDLLGRKPGNVLNNDLYDEYVWRLSNWRYLSEDDTQEERIDSCLLFAENTHTGRARKVFEAAWKATWPEDFKKWTEQRNSDKKRLKELLK